MTADKRTTPPKGETASIQPQKPLLNLISCRANFTTPASFGPTQFQADGEPLPGYPRFLNGWLLIHGYHNTAEAAEASYNDIAQRLEGVPLTGYLWPGGDLALDFPLAVIRARETGWRLGDMLNGLQFSCPTLGVQTHSLGVRPLLTALCSAGVMIGDVMISAPAADRDCLNQGGEFEKAPQFCRSLNVFYSANDPVLARDYPMGSFGHQALGLHGPVPDIQLPPNVRLFDCSKITQTHGGYRYAPEYYTAWRSIMDGSARPGLTVL